MKTRTNSTHSPTREGRLRAVIVISEDRATSRPNAAAKKTLHLAAYFFVLLLGACEAPQPKAPEPVAPAVFTVKEGESLPPEQAAPHVADAEAEILLAEQTILVALSPAKDHPPKPSTPAQPGAGTGPAPPVVSQNEQSSPCAIACSALSSMKRSAAYLCKLTGAADQRCSNANGRVAAAEARVSGAGCACKPNGT
ncbi:MAG: hypothetical protein HOW73_37295 [Polyangiaceae bacterium]|nr:hypothetical protein [Polyangiaceae bacterium]